MKADATPHVANAAPSTIYPSEPCLFTKGTIDPKEKDTAPSLIISTNSTVVGSMQNGIVMDDQWNSLEPVSCGAAPAMETRNDVDVALKFGNDMPSFASMVMAFMVMSLQIFANLQKANMDMALNQLNLVVTDMKRQIAEMEAEKESTFKKDMIMAGLEVASAVVQFVGSAVTVYQLKGKITEQGDIYNSEKASSLQAKTEKTIAETSTKVNRASGQAHQGGLDAQLQSRTNSRIEAARSDLNNVKTEKANADNTLGVPDTPEGFNQKYNKIKSEVDYINTRQHAIAGASALMKAFSPLVQGLLGSEATTHQIGAKSSENAKEIRNSVYRQHMEWAAAIRDAISRVLAMLQEVQRQDPENAMAISKKMA